MDILFLFWSFVGGLLAWNVFRPLRWSENGYFIFLTFPFNWIIGDLALHWILINFAIACLFYAFGALESGIGQLALGLNLISWGALLWRYKKLLGLHSLVERRMCRDLGNDYHSRIHPHYLSRTHSHQINWSAYWNPTLLLKNPAVERISNITFHEEPGVCLKLDIYRPTQSTSRMPVLLQIHGGAWSFGTKNQCLPLMTRLAEQGWFCVAATYRLSPEATFPAQVIDCKRAIHWIKQNAESYGADPEFIVVSGGSAGGHLSSLTALTLNLPAYQPGFESVDTTVKGCIAYYGIYDFESPFGTPGDLAKAKLLELVMRGTPDSHPHAYRMASPIRQISETPPPFLIIQGETDPLVYMDDVSQFYQALKQAHTPNLTFLQLPLVGHAFDIFPTLSCCQVLPAVERYLALLRTEAHV